MTDQLTPAAEYVRMSTEDQKYSIMNQQAVIAEYARAHNYQIVESYCDPGISGLDLKHRAGLKALLKRVVSGAAPFGSILVLDVSRWGRFQDIDESAYYEFLCRKADVRIQYCAEPFTNDCSSYSNLVKAIKRTMAAEYSRELSTKVFRGQARLAGLGFKQGGAPQIGLRRLLVDSDGNPKQLLSRGERKGLATDRVRLVSGPISEVRFVRNVFKAFLDGRSVASIARELQLHKRFGRDWDATRVLNLLQNPQYGGNYVYNRLSVKLGTPIISNPPEQWIVAPGAVEAIVPTELFDSVQRKLGNFTCRLSDDELLRRLRDLWDRTGYLSVRLIDKSRALPSVATYRSRFGSMKAALKLIGYATSERGVTERQALATLRRNTWEALKNNLRENGVHLRTASAAPYDIHANGMPVFNLVFAYPVPGIRKARGPLWLVRPHRRAPIGRCVIAVLSLDRKMIREFVIARALRKTPVRRVLLSLPLFARISLARFTPETAFFSAMQAAARAMDATL